MRLAIAAVGKMRSGPEAALVEDYLRRANGLGRRIGFSGPELKEVEAPKSLSGAKRRTRESDLLRAAAPDAYLIVLDERGKQQTSAEFAAMLAKIRDGGARQAAFLIGGADGHDQSLTQAADISLSLGAATWPHMLVRTMLAEQLYRAMTILTGHPYHRA